MFSVKKSFYIYIAFCSLMAFFDFKWDAEDERTARQSLAKQVIYMNENQKRVYMSDLDVIYETGRMGGARGRLLHKKDSDEIHDLANDLRAELGRPQVDLPSKTIFEYVVSFFVVPFAVLIAFR